MAFVYKYTDKSDGLVKYVGIVCREGKNALNKRIKEHSNVDDWATSHNWDLHYIEVKTKNDAHALEGHFIAYYKSYEWFNKAKADYGLLSFVDSNKFEWKPFNQEEEVLNQYFTSFDSNVSWRAEEELRTRYLSEPPKSLDQMLCQKMNTFIEGDKFLKRLKETKSIIETMKQKGKSIEGRDIDTDLKEITDAIIVMEYEMSDFYKHFGGKEKWGVID